MCLQCHPISCCPCSLQGPQVSGEEKGAVTWLYCQQWLWQEHGRVPPALKDSKVMGGKSRGGLVSERCFVLCVRAGGRRSNHWVGPKLQMELGLAAARITADHRAALPEVLPFSHGTFRAGDVPIESVIFQLFRSNSTKPRFQSKEREDPCFDTRGTENGRFCPLQSMLFCQENN